MFACLHVTNWFQAYVDSMKLHLDVATNPYDASMEVVMPGVQERFNAQQTMIHGVEAKIDVVDAKVDKVLRNQQEGSNTNSNNMVLFQAATFETVARALRENMHLLSLLTQGHSNSLITQGNTNTTDPPLNNNSQHPPVQESPQNNNGATNAPRLSPRYASLALMWEEWHGTGGPTTRDKPIPGGFAELERTQKNKWRQHLDGAQGRHFTRIRVIIEGIKKMAELSTTPVEVVRDNLEETWQSCKRSPDTLIKHLQERGCVKKTKPRGKGVTR